MQEKTTLIREDVFKRSVLVEGSASNTVVPKISNNLSVVEASVSAKNKAKRALPSEVSCDGVLVVVGMGGVVLVG